MSEFHTIKSGNTWVVEYQEENWIIARDPELYEDSVHKELLFKNRSLKNGLWKNFLDTQITDEIALLRPEVSPIGTLGFPGAVYTLWGVRDGLCLIERKENGHLSWRADHVIRLTPYSQIAKRRK